MKQNKTFQNYSQALLISKPVLHHNQDGGGSCLLVFLWPVGRGQCWSLLPDSAWPASSPAWQRWPAWPQPLPAGSHPTCPAQEGRSTPNSIMDGVYSTLSQELHSVTQRSSGTGSKSQELVSTILNPSDELSTVSVAYSSVSSTSADNSYASTTTSLLSHPISQDPGDNVQGSINTFSSSSVDDNISSDFGNILSNENVHVYTIFCILLVLIFLLFITLFFIIFRCKSSLHKKPRGKVWIKLNCSWNFLLFQNQIFNFIPTSKQGKFVDQYDLPVGGHDLTQSHWFKYNHNGRMSNWPCWEHFKKLTLSRDLKWCQQYFDLPKLRMKEKIYLPFATLSLRDRPAKRAGLLNGWWMVYEECYIIALGKHALPFCNSKSQYNQTQFYLNQIEWL